MSKIDKPKPDDKSDNIDKIRYHISNTEQNMELADEVIHKTNDEQMKQELKEKNQRRNHALNGMKDEIRDETRNKKKGNR